MPEPIWRRNPWPSGGGFNVEYANGSYNQVNNTHLRDLHAALTEAIAEQDAKRWTVRADAPTQPHWWFVTRKHTSQNETVFRAGTPEQNKADAEEYAAKLNTREGLS